MKTINVIPSSGNGFTMNLRNGSIKVDDKTGMYVISTGMTLKKSTGFSKRKRQAILKMNDIHKTTNQT